MVKKTDTGSICLPAEREGTVSHDICQTDTPDRQVTLAGKMGQVIRKTGKAILRLMALLLGAILLLLLVSPIITDLCAWRLGWETARIPLPPDTEIVEKFSRAGKLNGNGNGMQFLGGILLRSNMTLKELQDYYRTYEDSYIVEAQKTGELAMVEHGDCFLSTSVSGDNYYVVYLWGQGISPFCELDLRGH